MHEGETRFIRAIENNGTVLVLNTPLEYSHTGGPTQTYGTRSIGLQVSICVRVYVCCVGTEQSSRVLAYWWYDSDVWNKVYWPSSEYICACVCVCVCVCVSVCVWIQKDVK